MLTQLSFLSIFFPYFSWVFPQKVLYISSSTRFMYGRRSAENYNYRTAEKPQGSRRWRRRYCEWLWFPWCWLRRWWDWWWRPQGQGIEGESTTGWRERPKNEEINILITTHLTCDYALQWTSCGQNTKGVALTIEHTAIHSLI